MDKPRSDAKLLNLLPHQQEQIVVWLTEGVGDNRDTKQEIVLEQIYQEWGVRSSKAALTHFWRKVVAPRRLRQSAQAAGAVIESAEGSGMIFEGAAREALRQKTFEILADPDTDAKTLAVFYGLMQEGQKLQLKREEVEISKAKFQRTTCELFLKWYKDKRAQEIVASGTTQSEMIEVLGRAMFDDWKEEA